MELKEPLLGDHKAQERGYAAAALAGKHPGGDPGAVASSSDLYLVEVKESVEKQPGVQENQLRGDTPEEKKLDEDAPVRQEVKKSENLPIEQDETGRKKSEDLPIDLPIQQGSKKSQDLPIQQAETGSKRSEDLPIQQAETGSKRSEDLPIQQAETGSKKSEDLTIQQAETKKSEDLPIQQEIGRNLKKDPSDGKKPHLAAGNQELALSIHKVVPTLELLKELSSALAKSAAGTSMAATAEAFSCAVERFSAGKDRKKRATDTEMSKSAMALFFVAQRAPLSEAGLADVAIKSTSDAQMCLLSDTGTDSKPGLFVGWWRRRQRSSTSGPEAVKQKKPFNFKQWLRVALSAPKPMLPIHDEREKKLVDKREVLYALALGAPLAILTSATGLHIFPDAWAWVAGASVGVWILTASGTVLNQYSQLDCERLAAKHLGRLGVLGAALLLCFFTYSAFFPSAAWGFWFLVVIAAIALIFPWIVSCVRGDDDFRSGLGSVGNAVERAGELEMPWGGSARRWTI